MTNDKAIILQECLKTTVFFMGIVCFILLSEKYYELKANQFDLKQNENDMDTNKCKLYSSNLSKKISFFLNGMNRFLLMSKEVYIMLMLIIYQQKKILIYLLKMYKMVDFTNQIHVKQDKN